MFSESLSTPLISTQWFSLFCFLCSLFSMHINYSSLLQPPCFLPCLLRGLTPPHIGGLPSLLVIGHPKSLDHCCLCASVTSLFPSSICLTISPSRFGFCLQHTAVYCLSFYILFYPSSPFVVLHSFFVLQRVSFRIQDFQLISCFSSFHLHFFHFRFSFLPFLTSFNRSFMPFSDLINDKMNFNR